MPIGTVKKIEDEYAIVTIERQDMCGECHACEMLGEVKKCEIRCLNDGNVKIEDQVEIDLSNHSFMKATALMYGVPLVGLVVGLALGACMPETLGQNVRELGMIIGGLGLMTVCFLWIRARDKKKRYTELLPSITRTIDKNKE